MAWYGWCISAVMVATAILFLPLRVETRAAFSLFDAKVGVRVSVCGLSMLRLLADGTDGRLLLGGKPLEVRRDEKRRGNARKALLLARAFASTVRYEVYADLLLGTYDDAYRWIPPALCSVANIPHLHLRTYTDTVQNCKGVVRVDAWVSVAVCIRALLRYRRSAT